MCHDPDDIYIYTASLAAEMINAALLLTSHKHNCLSHK